MSETGPAATTTLADARVGIPRTVWVLGLVSLFMDLSSEIIHALLPVFLTTTLGASVALVGLIDGIGESTASITKMFSGYISDRIGRRKPLILLGYGLGAVSKPLFAIATGPMPVLGARFADRIGKGLRGAPRDALVADVTTIEIRGRAYGLRQALDTVGAFLGPLAAIALMFALADNMRAIFWIALIPALLSVLLVIFGVGEAERKTQGMAKPPPLRLAELKSFDRGFWMVVAVGVVFTLARFSESFLVLKANGEGLPLAWTPLVLVVMNLVYSLGSYPAGAIADRVNSAWPMAWGLVCLILADLMLAFGVGLFAAFAGIALWGAHMALTQGILAKLVADATPEHLRGSGFGLFNLATGIAMLFASLLAGVLWSTIGSAATFLVGAMFVLVAGSLLMIARRVGGS
ncbi:MFS transporter [Sphingobium sp. TKS]|uniref:MFS transporter n=1 Tax=Sphingobium sp. TKS TaxID=1315974 RepID=UPI00077063E3|nr:MFS transporter [Sphingobium sp. TKS]AMK21583.1 major facilitator transporter [Sphingobium sp. TKS]